MKMKILRFRKGGIHPDGHKDVSDTGRVERIELPKTITLLTRQNIGAPSKCVVKKGDTVVRGGVVAEAGGFVGAPVHSPVDGTVLRVEQVRDASGYWAEGIVIEVGPTEMPEYFHDMPQEAFVELFGEIKPEEIISRVGDAGIVGLGGAAFPTRVKLTVPAERRIDTFLVNGAECEPWLTCDDTLMRLRAEDILRGSFLLAKACRARRVLVGIEANKPEAIKIMGDAVRRMEEMILNFGLTVEVHALRTRYPQGSEKQLIQALTGRVVPAGGLPSDVNCVVDNVATAYAAYQAVCFSEPLTRRIVTVTGPDVKRPGNYLVCNGSTYRQLIEAAGGVPENTGKVISGGPMMGKAVAVLDAPLTKGVGGIVVLPESMSHRGEERPCIRCARCVEACPMGLQPYLIMKYSELHLQQEAESAGVMNCLECGCCSYVCPSWRPLLDSIRLSKSIIRKNQKKK